MENRFDFFKLAGWIVLFLLIIYFTVLSVAAALAWQGTMRGQAALLLARNQALQLSFDQAGVSLLAAEANFNQAKKAFWLINGWQGVPYFGWQIQGAYALVLSGREVAASSRELMMLGTELVRLAGLTEEDIRAMAAGGASGITFGDLSTDIKQTVLSRVSASAKTFGLLEARL